MGEALKNHDESHPSEWWEDLPRLFCYTCKELKPFWRDEGKLICIACDEEHKEYEKNQD